MTEQKKQEEQQPEDRDKKQEEQQPKDREKKQNEKQTGRSNQRDAAAVSRFAALCGMMIALAFLFGYIETLIPISLGVPGIKLGLANLVTMVSLYLLGAPAAAVIALVRVVLTGFTFGNLSMMMYGLAGSVVSLALMLMFRKLDWFSPVGISILGGVGHNIGQLAVAAAVLESSTIFYYLPMLLIAGLLAGGLIGILCGRIVKRLVSLPDLRYNKKR